MEKTRVEKFGTKVLRHLKKAGKTAAEVKLHGEVATVDLGTTTLRWEESNAGILCCIFTRPEGTAKLAWMGETTNIQDEGLAKLSVHALIAAG